MAFAPLRPSAAESDIQTAVALVAPVVVIQKPCSLGSVGDVEETKMANWVVGLELGLPFASFVKLSVEVVSPDKVGAPGIAAAVYVDDALEVAV